MENTRDIRAGFILYSPMSSLLMRKAYAGSVCLPYPPSATLKRLAEQDSKVRMRVIRHAPARAVAVQTEKILSSIWLGVMIIGRDARTANFTPPCSRSPKHRPSSEPL
jgi:hypothetical protein